MFKNEAERGIKKDVREYLQEAEGSNQINSIIVGILDSKFDRYAKDYQDRTVALYKNRCIWIFGVISAAIAGLTGGTGFTIMLRKKKKKENKNEDN